MDKICSFFGHRTIACTERLIDMLTKTIENLILKEGYTQFFFGGFGEFDECCYRIVSRLKEDYLDVKTIYCVVDERLTDVRKGADLRVKYDEVLYLSLAYDYWYTRIYYRNCAMIEKSDYTIFYVEKRQDSGAYKALQYAKRRKKDYLNIIELL